LRVAQRAFHQQVDFATLDSHVVRIRDQLNGLRIDSNVWAGTCDNTNCNTGSRNALAVTLDDLSGIELCPFYFGQSARTQVITLIHEAGHMARIDVNWAAGNERYCHGDGSVDCVDICPITGENLLENVDAWAQFMYCLAHSG
jgi:hypothetical protein